MAQLDQQLIEEFMATTGKLRAVLFNNASGFHHAHRGMRHNIATGLQLRALSIIEEKPGITASELAQEFSMSSPAIAQLLFRMFRTKWVNRDHDQNDRRVLHLSLTEIGKQELKQLKQQFAAKFEPILSLIPEADVRELVRIQKDLVTKLESQTQVNA